MFEKRDNSQHGNLNKRWSKGMGKTVPTQTANRANRWHSYGSLLRFNRSFRYLWIGQSINFLGDSFYDIALIWYVYAKTGSALQSGLILVCTFLPSIFFGMWFGTLIDRGDRRRWFVVTSLLQAVAAVAFGAIVENGHVHIVELYVITACLATGECAIGPILNSSIPSVVSTENIVAANAMMSFTRQLFRVLGSSLGGLAIAWVGASTAIYFDAASFIMAAILFARVSLPLAQTDEAKEVALSVWADIKSGMKWVFSTKNLVVILIISTVSNIGLGPVNVLPAVYIRHALHAGPAQLGEFDAAIGIGMILCSLGIGLIQARRVGLWFSVSLILQGVGMAIVAVAPNFGVSLVGNVVLGGAIVTAGVPLSAVFQALIPAGMRGRIGALTSASSNVSIPITYAVVGLLGDTIGARLSYLLGALLLAACGVAALCAKSVRATQLEVAPTVVAKATDMAPTVTP